MLERIAEAWAVPVSVAADRPLHIEQLHPPLPPSVNRVMREFQLRFDFDSTRVRLVIKGH